MKMGKVMAMTIGLMMTMINTAKAELVMSKQNTFVPKLILQNPVIRPQIQQVQLCTKVNHKDLSFDTQIQEMLNSNQTNICFNYYNGTSPDPEFHYPLKSPLIISKPITIRNLRVEALDGPVIVRMSNPNDQVVIDGSEIINGDVCLKVESGKVVVKNSKFKNCQSSIVLTGGSGQKIEKNEIQCGANGIGISVNADATVVQANKVSACAIGVELNAINAVVGADDVADLAIAKTLFNTLQSNTVGIYVTKPQDNLFTYNDHLGNAIIIESAPELPINLLVDFWTQDKFPSNVEYENDWAASCELSESGQITSYLQFHYENSNVMKDDVISIFDFDKVLRKTNYFSQCVIDDKGRCVVSGMQAASDGSCALSDINHLNNMYVAIITRPSTVNQKATMSDFSQSFHLKGPTINAIGTGVDSTTLIAGAGGQDQQGGDQASGAAGDQGTAEGDGLQDLGDTSGGDQTALIDSGMEGSSADGAAKSGVSCNLSENSKASFAGATLWLIVIGLIVVPPLAFRHANKRRYKH